MAIDLDVVQCQLCPNLFGTSSKTDRKPMVFLDHKFNSLAVSSIFSLELNGGTLMGCVSIFFQLELVEHLADPCVTASILQLRGHHVAA